LRQVVQQGLDRGRARGLKRLLADRHDRAVGLVILATDTRTRDGHFRHFIRFARLILPRDLRFLLSRQFGGGGHVLSESGRGAQGQREGASHNGRRQKALASGLLNHLDPPKRVGPTEGRSTHLISSGRYEPSGCCTLIQPDR
jgi:hypothetical protein